MEITIPWSSFYSLLARIFREEGCSRIASFWWDQDTGVDPTQPLILTLILTLSLRNPGPNPDQNGPETSQKQARLRRFRVERENSPTILNADHDSEGRTTPIQLLRQNLP